MNRELMVSSAFASLVALGALGTVMVSAVAQDMPKAGKDTERCYGIAKLGQNHCANLAGTHSCAGQNQADNEPGEWKYVAKGTCKELKGMTEAEAKAQAKGKK